LYQVISGFDNLGEGRTG